MKVWHLGAWIELDTKADYYVGRCGSGHTVFGEKARFLKATARNLIFETESGAIVKTKLDVLETVGKARKEGYWVGIGDHTGRENYITDPVSYWNDKKCCLENK